MAFCSSGISCDAIPQNHMVDISLLLLIYKNWCNTHQVHSTGEYYKLLSVLQSCSAFLWFLPLIPFYLSPIPHWPSIHLSILPSIGRSICPFLPPSLPSFFPPFLPSFLLFYILKVTVPKIFTFPDRRGWTSDVKALLAGVLVMFCLISLVDHSALYRCFF